MISACGYGLEMMNTLVGKAICMFNMPLFMGITGYFFYRSLTRSFKDLIFSKWVSWLRPTLIFSIFLIAWRLLVGVLPYPDIWKKVVVYFLFDFLCCYWFIPVAFLCCLIARIAYKIYPDILVSGIISWIMLVIFPLWQHYPILAYLKAMYPFFVLGILCRHHNWISMIRNRPTLIGISSLLVFTLLFPWFDKAKFFYSFTIAPPSEIAINYIALLAAGIAGSILSIILVNFLNKLNFMGKKFFIRTGAYTFSIYMIQQLFVQALDLMNLNILIPICITSISFLVFGLSVIIIKFCDFFKCTRVYLLGKSN